MSRIVSASLTTLLMLASASPLLATGTVAAAPQAATSASGPLPTNYPGCPPTTGVKKCNDTKTPIVKFTSMLDSLR